MIVVASGEDLLQISTLHNKNGQTLSSIGIVQRIYFPFGERKMDRVQPALPIGDLPGSHPPLLS